MISLHCYGRDILFCNIIHVTMIIHDNIFSSIFIVECHLCMFYFCIFYNFLDDVLGYSNLDCILYLKSQEKLNTIQIIVKFVLLLRFFFHCVQNFFLF